ncbi:MAG: malectin domain-containing carbohydrate-binding protein [Cyanobacteria bacterium P01_C01_bin.70]
MPISFNQVGTISGVVGGGNVLQNPTSLQFGPDGRLYVAEQNGSINAFTVSIENGEFVATTHEELMLPGGGGVVKSIQNHNDNGTESGNSNRQVTGILVTGTATEPVLYISSSDPRIAFNGEVNLDTNSGVLTQVSWDSTAQEWVAIDLIRGLPRSEENHAINGMELSPDGTKLYLSVGGNTNNGAPSNFFSYTAEYVLSGTILEIDLPALAALPTLTDGDAGQGNTPRSYKYDLPTLDDPNIPNVTDGVGEDEFGMDEAGPWGGNDGLNMAILPADAPLRIFASGMRNNYDLAFTPEGKLYTVDNGSNTNLGGNPVPEAGDADGDGISGEATNTPENTGPGDPEPLFLIESGGYYGHPNPTLSNQNQSWTAYNNSGNPDTSLSVNSVADISALVPNGVAIADGFLVDPSKMAALDGLDPTVAADLAEINARLFENGIRVKRTSNDSNSIVNVGSSTNGIVAYDSGGQAFNGVIDGKLFVTQFNDNLTLLNLNAAGDDLTPVLAEGPDGIFGTADDVVQSGGNDGILEVANNSLGVALANPLDVTVGPDGTLWVAEIGGNEITVLAPSDVILPGDNDSDDDGILNVDDPFLRDASNGAAVTITPGQNYLWDFDANQDDNLPGPDGFGGGLTGVMVNGTTDFEAFFQDPSPLPDQIINLDNVKFVTAAGGGTTVIEEVSEGDPSGTSNSGEFLFHTGVQFAPNVATATIQWAIFNPAGEAEFDGPNQQLGAYIGTGDQSNYLKVAAVKTGPSSSAIEVTLETDDVADAQTYQLATPNDLFDAATVPQGGKIFVELLIDRVNNSATPTVSYDTGAGVVTVTGLTPIDLTGSKVLTAIEGNYQVQGQPSGVAVGLFSTNAGQGSSESDRFQAVFDGIEITATEASLPPDAVDDSLATGINTPLVITPADLLANDTDPNPTDSLTITQVGNAVNGAVSLDDNGTPADASDDVITFTPNPDFAGQASFDYTVTDGNTTDTASAAVQVADEVVLYRVNAGGVLVAALASDPVQLAWAANTGTGAQSGNGFSNNIGNTFAADISNALEDASLPDYVPYQVFAAERWDGVAGPEMQWNFDVTAGGTYQVNLFLRNGFSGTNDAGERIFDIAIEGTEYFSDVDLSGTYGHETAAMLSQTLVVNDASLDIEFLHDVENPLINAIEIIQLSGDTTPTLPQLSVGAPTPAAVTESGDSDVTALLFPVSFDTTPDTDITVEYSVDINGSVTPGLTQALGTAGADILVEVPNDDLDNGAETVTVTLTSITVGSEAATLGTAIAATATVTEDDITLTDSFNGAAAPGNDFANDNTTPDDVTLGLGSNTLFAVQEPADNDYVTFEVAAGQQLIAANLLNYAGGTNATFLGIATGQSFPNENDLVNGVVLLDGGTIYDASAIDTDLLPLLTSTQVEGNGTPTADLPSLLGPGFYTLWFSQNGSPASASTLELVTEALVPVEAVDDAVSTDVNTALNLPVAQLLANDTSGSGTAPLFLTQVANAANGTVGLDDSGTPNDASDDVVIFTPAPDFVGQASFDYTVSDGTATDTASVTVGVTAGLAETGVLYRVNAGGAEVAALASDPVQLAWVANPGTGAQNGAGFANNTGNVATMSIATQARDASLPDYVPYQVFSEERWDGMAAPELQWNFDVTPGGTYQVNLFVRNGYSGTNDAGERIFDVAIEGTEYFSDVDLSGTYGHQVAAMLSQTIVVEDNSLDIEFLHDVENPLVNAIEIVQLEGEVPPTLPTVSILNPNQTVSEGVSGGQVQISIAADATVPANETVDVTFQIEPLSATPGSGGDYQYTSSSATFGGGVYTDTVSIAGSSSDVTIPIAILNDTELEGTEAFEVTIVSVSANAQIDSANSIATVTIADDDAAATALISLAAPSPATVVETGDTGTTTFLFPVSFDTPPSTDVTVEYSLDINGTVTTGLTQAIATSGGNISVAVPNDALANGDETVTVTLTDVTIGNDVATLGPATTAAAIVTEDDVATLTGAATLSINLNSNNVQISNFGNNSFQIENVGDKDITAVEIDVTNALYPDSVFDPFGLAGDTVSKALTINTAGGTGVIAPNNNPNDPNNETYIGAGGTAGYKGIKLFFDANANGGFNPGETVGFAIDMDPNSVAGTAKGPLDAGSSPSWDVGGVSGAELIGSTFTVTFEDGTTTTGQLQGAGNQGGSQGLVTQNPANLDVNLTVNGLGAGSVGTYGAGGPTVNISGPAGQKARIVLTKGFIQPVNPYAQFLANQLDALALEDFPANNAVEFQTVDVDLTGGSQDITSLFDFDEVNNYNFVGDDQLPLGFVASVIDPVNDNLPLGAVTQPIYLEFVQSTLPTVSVAAPTPAAVAESGDSGVTALLFPVSFDAAPDTDITVEYSVDINGSVTPGLTQALGIAGADILVEVPNDDLDNGAETVTVTLTSITAGNEAATLGSTTAAATVSEDDAVTPPPSRNVLYRVNAGGPQIAAIDGGLAWSADTESQNSDYLLNPGSNSTFGGSVQPSLGGTPDIAATTPAAIYATERWDGVAGSEMQWGFAVPQAGLYEVRLFMGNAYSGTNDPGERIFDVAIEGDVPPSLNDIDLSAQFGHQVGGVITYQANVTDGVLNIEFLHQVENPLINGIEIVQV